MWPIFLLSSAFSWKPFCKYARIYYYSNVTTEYVSLLADRDSTYEIDSYYILFSSLYFV